MTTSTSSTHQARLGLWLPEPGDSLAQTLSKVYRFPITDNRLPSLIELHLQLNFQIKSAHKPLYNSVIYLASVNQKPGEVLSSGHQQALVRKLATEKAALAGSKQRLDTVAPRSKEEVEAMRFVLGFNETMGHIGAGIGIGTSTASTLTGKHLQADLLDFNRWAQEKASRINKASGADLQHHYDARMSDVVRRVKTRLGPLESLLFNGSSTEHALHHGVPQSLRPNPITISAAERIRQVASSAKFGGYALVLVDAALTCQKLSATAEEEKVITAYKEIGGITASLMAGVAIGISLTAMATPVGWAGAIVISSLGAYGGKSAGESFAKGFYKLKGDVFELKDGKLLNKWCN